MIVGTMPTSNFRIWWSEDIEHSTWRNSCETV